MIIDVSGIVLFPGNNGKNCKGNGKHKDFKGKILECCCDECDYLICCTTKNYKALCLDCDDKNCPRNHNYRPCR